jgi:hypothetical protein
MSHIHLGGDGNVMSGTRLGEVLAILRHRGEARDGQEKGTNNKSRENALGERCKGVEYPGFCF